MKRGARSGARATTWGGEPAPRSRRPPKGGDGVKRYLLETLALFTIGCIYMSATHPGVLDIFWWIR